VFRGREGEKNWRAIRTVRSTPKKFERGMEAREDWEREGIMMQLLVGVDAVAGGWTKIS